MDRDADRLMVAYLYLEFAAMFVDESYFASEAPLCRMDADGRNHARLAADDVRRNFRTITLDLQRLRMRVALMVVDAHIPAAEVVEGQSGAVEPLAESVARPADERTALAVLLRARALTQNVEVGGNRPVGVYDWAAEQCGFHGSMVSRRSACVDQSRLRSRWSKRAIADYNSYHYAYGTKLRFTSRPIGAGSFGLNRTLCGIL